MHHRAMAIARARSGPGLPGRAALALGLLLLALGWAAAPAAALDLGQWVPGLRLTPFLTEKVEYNSNVFQVPSGEQDDVIFWTIPGFVVDYTLGDYSLSAGYRAEIQNYLELTDQNFVNHIGAVQFLAELPRFTFGVRDDFIRTNEPPTTELTGPIGSNTNLLRADVEYRYSPRLSFGANAGWVYVNYDEDPSPDAEVIDRSEVGAGLTVFWRLFPRGDVRFDGSYRRFIFLNESSRDVNVFDFTAGLRGEITEKISSGLRAGVQVRDAEQGNTGFTGFVFSGDVVYRPFTTTSITLTALRQPVESTFEDEPFYVTTAGSLALRQEFLRSFGVDVRVAGGINVYPDHAVFGGQTGYRKDTFLAAGVGLDYRVAPWLLLGVEYRHVFRHSNFDAFDFDQDRVWAKATLQF
jgi:hypothetical protein